MSDDVDDIVARDVQAHVFKYMQRGEQLQAEWRGPITKDVARLAPAKMCKLIPVDLTPSHGGSCQCRILRRLAEPHFPSATMRIAGQGRHAIATATSRGSPYADRHSRTACADRT